MSTHDYYIRTQHDGTVEIVKGPHLGGGQFPQDERNTDYAAYLEWVAAGNTPEPWQPDANPDIINNGGEE